MPPTHKQAFWTIEVGTGDIEAPTRAQIAKAALMLNKHPLVIQSVSASGYNYSEKPEIALIFEVDFAEVPVFTGEIESALAEEGLGSVRVTLQDEVRWFTFDETHLEAFRSSIIGHIDDARRSIDDLVNIHIPGLTGPLTYPKPTNLATELAARLSQFTGILDASRSGPEADAEFAGVLKAARGTKADDIPAGDSAEMMLITKAKYESMRDARDAKVEAEITSLKKTLADVAKESKTTSQVAIMVADGFIAIGSAMVTAYGYITAAGSLAAAISGIIAAVGGAAVVAGLAAAVVAIFLAIVIFLKE